MYLLISDIPFGEDYLEERRRFTDVVPSRPPVPKVQIAAISLDGTSVIALGRMSRREQKAASYKWHVTLDSLVVLPSRISFKNLTAQIPQKHRAALERSIRRGAQLDEGLSAVVIEAIAALTTPSTAELIARLTALCDTRREPQGGDGARGTVAFERDAVGVALELAGLHEERTETLSDWSGDETEPFFEGISLVAREDPLIQHDAKVFGDWKFVKSSMVGATRFSRGGRSLTVINVNRTAVEESMGVDLIYYSGTFKAYVLVQYKRLEETADEEKWSFRPDGQFEKEAKAMRKLRTLHSPPSAMEYRLDGEFCFLKLCHRRVVEPYSADLVRGLYLPLGYYDALHSGGHIKGPRGGTAVGYSNALRHINNTLFIDLVQDGWVGSQGLTTDQVTEVIKAGLARKNSVILASSAAARGS
jgi:hypothetical protein